MTTDLKFHEYLSKEQPKALVILLHGYGSNGADLFSMKDQIIQILGTDIAILSPDAPFTCEMGMGEDYRQWFSLSEYTKPKLDEGAKIAFPYVRDFVLSQAKRLDVPLDKVVLAGFSQGCMMSLYTALRLDTAVAAVIGWSGMLLGDEDLATELTARPKIQLWHGDQDAVVPPQMTGIAEQILKEHGLEVEAYLLKGLEHGIMPQQLVESFKFVKAALKQ